MSWIKNRKRTLLTAVRDIAKGKNKHWLVAPFILLSVMFLVSLSSALESNVVAIEEVTVSPDEIFVVPIVIERATGVGGIGIKLSYDPSVVNVTDATMGNFTAFFSFDNINAAKGWISLNTYILGQDLTGDVKVADVTLEAVGNAGASSLLNLTILSMADQYGTEVNGTTDDGVFVISSPSNEGGGASNGATTTPHPTSTPPVTSPSTPPTAIPTKAPESSPTPESTQPPHPMITSTPSTSRSTSNLSSPSPIPESTPPPHPMTTSTPRTPGFKALLGIAVILVVRRWFILRSKEKY
jgi:hypothetical protein